MNIIKDSKHKNPDTTRVAPFKISYFLGKEGDFQKDYAINILDYFAVSTGEGKKTG